MVGAMLRAGLLLLLFFPLLFSVAPQVSTAIQAVAAEDADETELVTHLCDGCCHPNLSLDSAVPSLSARTPSVAPAVVLAGAFQPTPLLGERAGVRRMVERPPAS